MLATRFGSVITPDIEHYHSVSVAIIKLNDTIAITPPRGRRVRVRGGGGFLPTPKREIKERHVGLFL